MQDFALKSAPFSLFLHFLRGKYGVNMWSLRGYYVSHQYLYIYYVYIWRDFRKRLIKCLKSEKMSKKYARACTCQNFFVTLHANLDYYGFF